MIPDYLPQLAIGSHPIDSGKACIMNFISYLSGDAEVTDTPLCVDTQVALVMQYVNDAICWHGAAWRKPGAVAPTPGVTATVVVTPGPGYPSTDQWETKITTPAEQRGWLQQPEKLCPSCTHEVFMLGQYCMGTAGLLTDLDHIRLAIQMITILDRHNPEYIDVQSRGYLDTAIQYGVNRDEAAAVAIDKLRNYYIPAEHIRKLIRACVLEGSYFSEPLLNVITELTASAITFCFDGMMDEDENLPEEKEFNPDSRAANIIAFARTYLAEVERIADANTFHEFTEEEYRRVKEMANI